MFPLEMSKIGFLVVFWTVSVTSVSSCGFPGSPAHAKLRTTDERFMEGTVVTFECDPGYQLLGRSALRCVKSKWDSPGLPFCVREIASFKPASMSSESRSASFAVDDSMFTCAETEFGIQHEWRVDLIEESSIHIVEVHYGIELKNLTISITVEDSELNATTACFRHKNLPSSVTTAQYFKCHSTTSGRKLSITFTADHWFILRLCEVKVHSQSVLSPQVACGGNSRGKIESLKGQCYETTPTPMSLPEAEEFCNSQGGSLWSGAQSEFVSWMMDVHDLRSVWHREQDQSSNANATNSTVFPRDGETPGSDIGKHSDTRFGICIRPPRSCGMPALPKHLATWKSIDEVATGETLADFSCEDGYYLSGPVTQHCLKKGAFQKQMATTCNPSPCGEPPEVPNAYPVITSEPRYYCVNDSFALYGSPNLKCDNVTSRWTTPHVICVLPPADSIYGDKDFRERLLQGVHLFPVATKVGLVSFIVAAFILKILAVVAITNLIRYYRVIKPKLEGKQCSSIMLSSMHDELTRDARQASAGGEQDRNNLRVSDANQELDLSTGDAQVVIRTTGSSTPKAPRTPNLRLNESSITENKTF